MNSYKNIFDDVIRILNMFSKRDETVCNKLIMPH